MIINFVRNVSTAQDARVRTWPEPLLDFQMTLPEDFDSLPAHRMVMIAIEGDARIADLVMRDIQRDQPIRIVLGRPLADDYREIDVNVLAYRVASGTVPIECAEASLREVYDGMSDERSSNEDFMAMVYRHAEDPFYERHLVAREYILWADQKYDNSAGPTR
jgi:hypothetical protein